MGTVYNITKQLCGNCNHYSAPMKDKNGHILPTEREHAARWVQHFKEVLNHPDLVEPVNTDPPAGKEVRNAINAMKSGKNIWDR